MIRTLRSTRRWLVLVALGLAALSGHAVAAPPAKLTLTWFGQSCFLIESATGTRIVTDPIPKGIGYELPVGLRADAVTISHEHPDHNNVALVTGRPRVFRGLTADKKGWTKIDDKVKDITVRSVGVYHDDKRGAERGLNAVFIFESGGLRIAHLGDLGHVLDDDQLSAIGSVDVVLVPVGGHFTIDARQATRVIDQLHPRLVIVPMHYRTAASTIPQLSTIDEFLAGKANVRKLEGNTLPLSAIKSRPGAEIVVMNFR
ncbi:MAG TPA: MBL fold metallo-hydrolase [Polyangia bacterium]|jgi:L-ascorbate metabolism protein UlaG (beta-lactamase superfamily)